MSKNNRPKNNRRWIHIVVDSEFFDELEQLRNKLKEPNRAAFYRMLLRLGLDVLVGGENRDRSN